MNLLDIKEALNFGSKAGHGIGSLFAEARDPAKWEEIKASTFYREILGEIRAEAEEFLNRPVRALPYSLFKLFEETGSRKEFELEYFEHRARLNTLAILALIDGGPKYLGALEDIIWAICDEYTWCLPAHLKDNYAGMIDRDPTGLKRYEFLRQKLRDQQQTLDLFATETSFALAEIFSLLEEKLSPLVVCRGRSEVFRRVLEPYGELNPLLWWETSAMNWAAVCAGSIGAAAMYLIEDDLILTPVLHRVLDTMNSFLAGFGDDGACPEGICYWAYGFGFFTYFAALFKQRTGGKIDLFQDQKIKQIALFQQKCYLTGNYVICFSDASLTENYLPGLTHYLKTLFGEVLIPHRKYQASLKDNSNYRWAHAVRNLVWRHPKMESDDLPAEAVYFFQDAQWFISRKSIKGAQICFAVKGGHNDEPHNHNDLGSFILHVNGDNLLADLGRGEYTRQYFGPERYEFLCTSSRGHSVPIIDGNFQKQGPEYAARMIDQQSDPTKDLVIMDIGKAYGDHNLKSLVRRFIFEKLGAVQVLLKDELEFERVPTTVTERLITLYKPRFLSDGNIRIQGLKSSIDLKFDHSHFHPEIHREVFMTHELAEKEVFIIDFNLTPVTTTMAVEITFLINGGELNGFHQTMGLKATPSPP